MFEPVSAAEVEQFVPASHVVGVADPGMLRLEFEVLCIRRRDHQVGRDLDAVLDDGGWFHVRAPVLRRH